MMLGDLDSYMQKNETWPPTYSIHKNKFKMDKRHKYKSWHPKRPRGEHRQEHFRYSTQQYFTNMSPRTKNIKERRNKWDFIQLKSFCPAKENISKMKREPTVWENVLASDTWDKGLTAICCWYCKLAHSDWIITFCPSLLVSKDQTSISLLSFPFFYLRYPNSVQALLIVSIQLFSTTTS